MYKLTTKHLFYIKLLIHSLNAYFFGFLIVQVFSGNYGADPVQAITAFTGISALNLLLITMSMTPLAKWLKQSMLFRCKRVLGLYCFFWTCLHMLTFFWLNLGLDFSLLSSEIINRPYLTLGAVSWFILFALAATSTNKIQRKMGKNWQKLHNWVYLVLLLAPIHFYWSVKSETVKPSIYIAIALCLLALRKNKLFAKFKNSRQKL